MNQIGSARAAVRSSLAMSRVCARASGAAVVVRMTQKLSPLAPAAAAIAAVLAFPATAHATAAPAPAPVIDIAPVAQPAPAPVPAPAPAPSIVIAPAPPPAPPAETAQQTAAPAAAREAARAATRERTAAAPVARARAASAPAAATSDAAVAEAPVGVPVETAAPTVAVLPEPTLEEIAPVAATDSAADDTIAYALLGAGAAALGIGGIAFAARRRRRIADRNVDTVPMTDRREAPVRDPVMQRAAPAIASPAPAPLAFAAPQQQQRTVAAPRAGVGRHEAMVDYGPTVDNPFLTRRNRLRRARFLDRMEANGWLPREERRMAGAR